MAEILGLGVTHSPPMLGIDENMARITERVMRSDRTPVALRNPSGWPTAMQHEWAEHQAGRAAPAHRQRLVAGFRAVRKALDEFNPDFVLIWGDDQYENFREDGVAPFCVFALDAIESQPFARMGSSPNVWGYPAEFAIRTKGHPEAGRHIATALIGQGFDISYAYSMRYEQGLPHAFINALLLLDYDQRGFPWPVVPFHVNCYGTSTISKRGAFAHIDGTGSDEPDPPGPTAARCFAIGAATARALAESPWRVAVVASSSWSHAFLVGKHHYLYPDIESDRARFEELRDGQLRRWKDLTTPQLEDAGQQELLNWVCLAGAMAEQRKRPLWSELVETHIFAACKCFTVFEAA